MTNTNLQATRAAEYEAAKSTARTAAEAYWAGSCIASVLRDYHAGRVTVIKAGQQ